ncbi:ADP-ribosylglycohydrolase family protein [Bifidobacterium aquikefiri]|uniref:ADP-ribosylation Crystallin J1 n=1 Tax=Bifidobacterium aquikefiri TaxID=1653207 RepID=A0A261G6Z8_9BIFI|nr:ADP-ribosylglycohydrolase family protein [Bifidobacterium aquikefiri]OZG67227.1 ADP-ribosylation Crystallin J1 [Bifidobacterium aquikefiri]
MNDVTQSVLNVLLSIAYGDAMGMPTENLTRQQIAERYGTLSTLMPSPSDVGTFIRHLDAGTVTDDTENTIFMSKMLIDSGGRIDSHDFVDYLTDWLHHDEKSSSVVGPSTRRAIEAIERGVSMEQSGIWGTTNGAAMKIAPIGLVSSCLDLPQLVENVAAICKPTHNTQIAIQGASVIAALDSFLFMNEDVDWNQYYDIAFAAAQEAETRGNKLPTPSIAKRMAYGRRIAGLTSEEAFQDELYSFLGTGLETIQTVPAAVTIVFRYRADLRKCVGVSANIGGDTDTIGAICGGMCGSVNCNLLDSEKSTLIAANSIDFNNVAFGLSQLVKAKR